MMTKAKGNMYPWVTHVHTHLGGECPHKCTYCYAQKGVATWSGRYKGAPRLIQEELKVRYGAGKTIFLEHMGDLFADGIDGEWIEAILTHARAWPKNTYVFQSKNPGRAIKWLGQFPPSFMFGTTIETNRSTADFSVAPSTRERAKGLMVIGSMSVEVFVTIEPIMDFDVKELVEWLYFIKPRFVNIGADSKQSGLPEPNGRKVLALIAALKRQAIVLPWEVREKDNLQRLLGGAQ